jgi:hypothetical protein
MRRYELEEDRKILIEEVVQRHLCGRSIRPCHIFEEVDDDGTRSVTVGLCYDFSERPVDPSETIAVLSALHDEFAKIGDERIVYLENYFDEKQKIKVPSRAC